MKFDVKQQAQSSAQSRGPGFLGFLGLLFIGLKLTEQIDWSWWWVLLPIYGPLLLVGIISLIVGGIYLFATAMLARQRRKNRKRREAARFN